MQDDCSRSGRGNRKITVLQRFSRGEEIHLLMTRTVIQVLSLIYWKCFCWRYLAVCRVINCGNLTCTLGGIGFFVHSGVVQPHEATIFWITRGFDSLYHYGKIKCLLTGFFLEFSEIMFPFWTFMTGWSRTAAPQTANDKIIITFSYHLNLLIV